ncbi:MAG: DUF4136 domain-containing protein [Candidatus Ancaeobacter aquaticus]|nr:DUF4136 domain-containing protein [Candidatus Ancaeobacter aquaticus]
MHIPFKKYIPYLVSCCVLFLSISFSGCSSIETYHAQDRSVDFTAIKTYRFSQSSSKTPIFDDELIKSAIDEQLRLRDLVKEEGGNTDCFIRYTISFRDMEKPYRVDMGPRDDLPEDFVEKSNYAAREWGRNWLVLDYQWKQANLIINMINSQTDSVLWTASADFPLEEELKPEERNKKLRKAIVEMFKKYPVKRDKETDKAGK